MVTSDVLSSPSPLLDRPIFAMMGTSSQTSIASLMASFDFVDTVWTDWFGKNDCAAAVVIDRWS